MNYADVDNSAKIADGVVIGASGDMEVKATNTTDLIAQGIATSTNTDSDTGVAAAVGLNIALIDNSAQVGNSADLTAGDIQVQAVMAPGQTNTFQSRALSGAASSDTAVGGSISVNYIDSNTSATVGHDADLHATAGDVGVIAESKNEIQNLAGGAALSLEGGTGVGVAVAVNIVNPLDTTASVGHDTSITASGSVAVTANATFVPIVETLPIIGDVGVTSFAAGIAGSSGGTVIGGSASVNVVFMHTQASIEDDSTVSAGQNVMVEATDTLHMFSAAGGLAASTGGSGVGIGIDVGVVERSANAWVGAGTRHLRDERQHPHQR